MVLSEEVPYFTKQKLVPDKSNTKWYLLLKRMSGHTKQAQLFYLAFLLEGGVLKEAKRLAFPNNSLVILKASMVLISKMFLA